MYMDCWWIQWWHTMEKYHFLAAGLALSSSGCHILYVCFIWIYWYRIFVFPGILPLLQTKSLLLLFISSVVQAVKACYSNKRQKYVSYNWNKNKDLFRRLEFTAKIRRWYSGCVTRAAQRKVVLITQLPQKCPLLTCVMPFTHTRNM